MKKFFLPFALFFLLSCAEKSGNDLDKASLSYTKLEDAISTGSWLLDNLKNYEESYKLLHKDYFKNLEDWKNYVNEFDNRCSLSSGEGKYYDHFKEIFKDPMPPYEVYHLFYYYNYSGCGKIRIEITCRVYNFESRFEIVKIKVQSAEKPHDFINAINARRLSEGLDVE